MSLLEFDPRLQTRVRRNRRRAAPEVKAPDLVDLLTLSIEDVNARAARRIPEAGREQDELISLLRWSIRLVEISKARAAAAADDEGEIYVNDRS